MDAISNMDIYLRRMAATLSDKCWWAGVIPPEIDTVVDYGCAQGDLALFLEKIHPGRFKYIGIDNSPEMWKAYCARLDAASLQRGECWGDAALRICEFLLKYKYTDNWDREMRETYFWNWLRRIERYRKGGDYDIAFDQRFHIPFIRNQINSDFGIDLPVETHRKVLMAAGDAKDAAKRA